MELSRRNFAVYGLLIAVWILVTTWQTHEHSRVKETARSDLRNRSKDIANTLSAFIRGLRFRGAVLQDRLEPVLVELVNSRTNELVQSSELISIALLNAAGEPVAQAGAPLDLQQVNTLQKGERWTRDSVILVNPVDLGALIAEEGTNRTIVLPPFPQFTNPPPDGPRRPQKSDRPPEPGQELSSNSGGPPPGPPPGPRPEREGRSRRPFWLRTMDDPEFQRMMEKRALHGVVLAMSTESIEVVDLKDLWLRTLILLLATISVVGSGLAWRNLVKSSELQIRLVRASEMNTHLREMNLAAAGLAHETRNPLNIIRGLAQMISRQPGTTPEIQQKSLDMIGEADKVAAQLNEFINYSRPREVRRTAVSLQSVVGEVTRALTYDLEEKHVKLEAKGEALSVEADEQLLRQALFNLLLNAVQAVDAGGEIQVVVERAGAREALLEVRDNGPGVDPQRRTEIFKPYFTTHQKGTGLGLAVVQQIVLAHGWEIECLPNQPKGAVFRMSHLSLAR